MVKLRDENIPQSNNNSNTEILLAQLLEGVDGDLAQLEQLLDQLGELTRNRAIAIGAGARGTLITAIATGLEEGLKASQEDADNYAAIFERMRGILTLSEQKRAAYALGNIAGRSPLEILPAKEKEEEEGKDEASS